MSDLSSNDTLDPLENTTPNDARDANIADNTPEDWESIIDFEMKNGKEDVTMFHLPTGCKPRKKTYKRVKMVPLKLIKKAYLI
jgi:hypothetical protein